MIPHFFPSVNTLFSRITAGSIRPIPVYYSSYICIISCNFIMGIFFLWGEVCPVKQKIPDFFRYFSIKTENYFPVYSIIFHLFLPVLIYIKHYIIFFYKELFTFST